MMFNLGQVARFIYFSQKVLPTVYDDSLSYLELLEKMEKYLNDTIDLTNEQSTAINELSVIVQELKDEFQQFQELGLAALYEQLLDDWMHENAERIVSLAIRNVYFGLTLDGHFIAYIPDTWADIVFDTGAVYGNERYGRLILKMDVDSPQWAVDQDF